MAKTREFIVGKDGGTIGYAERLHADEHRDSAGRVTHVGLWLMEFNASPVNPVPQAHRLRLTMSATGSRIEAWAAGWQEMWSLPAAGFSGNTEDALLRMAATILEVR